MHTHVAGVGAATAAATAGALGSAHRETARYTFRTVCMQQYTKFLVAGASCTMSPHRLDFYFFNSNVVW